MKRFKQVVQIDDTVGLMAQHFKKAKQRTVYRIGAAVINKVNQKIKDEDGNETVSGMIDDLDDGFGREYKNQIEKNILKSMVSNKKGTHDWL